MILLDTDVCVELLRGNRQVIERRRHSNDSIAISFMTVAELFYGAEKSSDPGGNRIIVDELVLSCELLHSDIDILRMFGQLKTSLERAGTPLADADIFIAATALAACDLLVTGNAKHYERIPDLRMDNWVAPTK